MSQPYREEVLNVKLAELLSKQNILSVPESIVVAAQHRNLPDITIADYWGVRVVLEGKLADASNAKNVLEIQCRERIERGIAPISIGVIYPAEVRNVEWASLDRELASAQLKIKVFTATHEDDWVDSDLNSLSEILRRAYESLVEEDTVDQAVTLLRNSIETAAEAFAQYRGTEKRFREILIVPKSAD
ncbi:MAG TPA: hypothetical protein VJZ32_11645 [Candidatus Bathyarchaeia archaeon]|nr:hypothetical protein [Candidatus Bathyarchaeia archaeon]